MPTDRDTGPFKYEDALGPKDRKLVAPSVRADTSILAVSKGLKGRQKPWRTFGALILNVALSPPLRTGLLNVGPSDLTVKMPKSKAPQLDHLTRETLSCAV